MCEVTIFYRIKWNFFVGEQSFHGSETKQHKKSPKSLAWSKRLFFLKFWDCVLICRCWLGTAVDVSIAVSRRKKAINKIKFSTATVFALVAAAKQVTSPSRPSYHRWCNCSMAVKKEHQQLAKLVGKPNSIGQWKEETIFSSFIILYQALLLFLLLKCGDGFMHLLQKDFSYNKCIGLDLESSSRLLAENILYFGHEKFCKYKNKPICNVSVWKRVWGKACLGARAFWSISESVSNGAGHHMPPLSSFDLPMNSTVYITSYVCALVSFLTEGVLPYRRQVRPVRETALSHLPSLPSVHDRRSKITLNNRQLCGNVLTIDLLLPSLRLWRLEALFEIRLWRCCCCLPIFRVVSVLWNFSIQWYFRQLKGR